MFSNTTAAILFIVLAGAYIFISYSACCSGYVWIDIPLHFLGGVFAAIVAVIFYRKNFKSKNKLFILVAIISGAVFIGASWELFEWILDNLVPFFKLPHEPNLNDTMSDLALDLLGSAATAMFFLRKKFNKQTS